MFTVNLIVANDVLATTGMTQQQLDNVIAGIEQAAALWSRYIDGNNAVIDINLGFDDLKDSQGNDGVLARAGSSFFTQNGGETQSEVINELNGQSGVFAEDGTFTLDLPDLLNDRFFFSNSLDFDQNPGANGQIDFLTLAAHELGHVLGFLSIGPFEDLVVNNQFIGANAVAANGGNPVQLADGVHTAGGDLLSPSISANLREPLNAVHIAILQDLGIPIHQATAAADTLYGFNAVDDNLNGGGGDDTLFGLTGNDTIDGGLGNDTINGGAGNDIINGGAGQGIDTVDGGAGNDTINGGNGVDFLSGGNGNDTISGQNKNDVLQGESGQDTLNGNKGNDTLLGGDDNDVLNGGASADTLNGQDGDDDLFGGGQADVLNGGQGMDELDGGSGNDILSGGSGDDILFGGNNNDTLRGNTGADELRGGAGNDNLTGGSDAGDIFVFDASDIGSDTITDYQDGLDSIRFTGGINAFDITVSDAGSTGQHAQIDIAGTGIVITVQNIDHTLIDANDFVFV